MSRGGRPLRALQDAPSAPDVPVVRAFGPRLVPLPTDLERLYVLPVVLTLADMAKLMDRSERTIREAVAIGQFEIARLKNSDRLLWGRAEVERWLLDVTWDPQRVDPPSEKRSA